MPLLFSVKVGPCIKGQSVNLSLFCIHGKWMQQRERSEGFPDLAKLSFSFSLFERARERVNRR